MQLSYVPDGRALSICSEQNRETGLIIHVISNPFNAEVNSGVSELLEAEGYLVYALDAWNDPEKVVQNLEAFIRNVQLWVPSADHEPHD